MRAPVLLLAVVAACGGDVPANPTWFADVQPILRANCARCHGADPSDPKIAKFRLDRYVKDDPATFDAWDYAQGTATDAAPMVRVAVDHEAPAMPPDYSLSDRQRDILARWVDQGAPKGTRANRSPKATLIAPAGAATADQSLDLTFRAWDDDLDGLVVQLWAHDAAGADADDVPVSAVTGAGQRTLTIDTGQLASTHTFEIYAVLDDGFADDPAQNRTVQSLVPGMLVDHGTRGTAPTVKLVAPNGGETLIGTTTITWTASDPDPGDVLTYALDLIAVAPDGTETVAMAIQSGITQPTASYAWTIPTSLSATQAYKIRVTATDAGAKNTRSDESDGTFTVAQMTTTTDTWDSVKGLFAQYCLACHGQPAKTAALEYFRVDKYDAADPIAPINADQGVYETRSTIYTRLVVQANMPPAGQPKPTAAERAQIGTWIQAGAPKGSGPANPPPTFVWDAPTATVTTSPATLTWHASDPDGLASGLIQYAKVGSGQPTTGCTAGNTGGAAWMTVADAKADVTLGGAMTWADTISWAVPSLGPGNQGYFCLRATVQDTLGGQSVVLNPNGVK